MTDLQPEKGINIERDDEIDNHFRQICLSSVVGNYGKHMGQLDMEGNESLLNIANRTINMKFSDGIKDQLKNNPEHSENTKVLFLPMNSMPEEIIDNLGLANLAEMNLEKEYAMLIEFNGFTHNTGDPHAGHNRRGTYGAAAIISDEMVEVFKDNIPENPEALYVFLQAINGEKGGHIRANDNTPMTMRLGDRKVVIVRNDRFGGKMKHDVESVPLDIDFDPNPYGGFRD